MKRAAAVAMMMFVAAGAFAQSKPCEELKADIAKKLDDKGVKGYTLEIVAKDKDAEKVVGTCEGGTKKIVYSREAAPAAAEKPAATSEKPAAKKTKQ